MPRSPTYQAIDDLRDAYLRLRYVLAMNELTRGQEWIADCLTASCGEIAAMLHHLQPQRPLPNLMKDTQFGMFFQTKAQAVPSPTHS